MGIGNSIINGTNHLDNSAPKPKLIIHETDCHGCGNIYYNGQYYYYSYDDGRFGDVRCTIEELIKIGFINREDVVIFDDDEEIYKLVEKGLSLNDR